MTLTMATPNTTDHGGGGGPTVSASWRVRDASDKLLAKRDLPSTSVDEDNDNSDERMLLSKYFDVDTCQARVRRDKTPIVKMALDAAASAILENLHKADDDENEETETETETKTSRTKDKRLPSLLEDIAKLQAMRVASMERAHANRDLAKRRIAVKKEQERELRAQQQKAEQLKSKHETKTQNKLGTTSTPCTKWRNASATVSNKTKMSATAAGAGATPANTSSTAPPLGEAAKDDGERSKTTKAVKRENNPATTTDHHAANAKAIPTVVPSSAAAAKAVAITNRKTNTNTNALGSAVSPDAATSTTKMKSEERSISISAGSGKAGAKPQAPVQGAVAATESTLSASLSSSPKKEPQPPSPATAVAQAASSAAPPKFTRNTPASSSSALEARLTGSRAILCTAANVAFDALTPALLPEWEVIDVADVPQNPTAVEAGTRATTITTDTNTTDTAKNTDSSNDTSIGESAKEKEPNSNAAASDGTRTKTGTVPNMGPVIIEAQVLGHRIENVATNAVKRSRRRFRFRKDNIRFRNNNNSISNSNNTGVSLRKRDSGFRILENPFAWKDNDEEADSGGSCPMEVDETVSVVTTDNNPSVMKITTSSSSSSSNSNNESETWAKVCIPRLLSILQTGIGNAILHDVMWSTRHSRIANLLQEISMMTQEDTASSIYDIGINTIIDTDSTDRNYGPHLIVTVGPDVDRFAKEFKASNSHLRFLSTVDERSMRALPYKGTKEERRNLRKQFPQATGLPEASFHVIIASYADFLTDYIHFCQTPFEVVIMDDGVSWMAAAHNDPNSPIATVWEDALFSKNDHQMGLAGTNVVAKEWDYGTDKIDEEVLREAWIGLTARHRLVTSSKLRVENPRSPADLLPVSGLLSFALPHFADTVKEEWDRSRIINDASSMSHFRKLLTRALVVHDPNNTTSVVGEKEKQQPPCSIYELAMKTLKGNMPESIRCKDDPEVPEEVSDDQFIADGKVASSRRSALQWLGPLEDSWLRYELGTVSFEPIMAAMKSSLMHGHICEEIATASSVTTGFTGQIIGNLAFKLGVRSGKSFSSEQGLRQHHSTHHAPPGTWLCRTCKVDCITSQARTHHERSCGQPSSTGGSGTANETSAISTSGASKNGTGKKKGKASKNGSGTSTKEEKDADGSVRVPSYRGVWVDQAGKYFIKIKSERVRGKDGKKQVIFESIEEAAKKYDELVKNKGNGDGRTKIEYNFKPNGTRIVYEDVPTSSATGLGGGVVPALSVVNIKDLPPDVKPLLRDPRQTSRTGGNSKRHVYAYRGVCRQARKGHDRWQSQISFLGVNHYLGTFDSEWDAAAIYAWAHLILYGEEATRQAQKEGEEAAAAYEQEKKDIAAGKIPATPSKPEKKANAASKKKTEDKSSKRGKKDTKKEAKAAAKRKPGRPKSNPDKLTAKQPPSKRLKAATGKEDITPILAQSVGKALILAPVTKFAGLSDDELMREASVRIVAARSVNYCITEVSLPAPIHMDFRPCVPWREESEDQLGGGALLVGLDPSLFGWNIDSIMSTQYFGSESERKNATEVLIEEFGEGGLNEHFRSLVQGSTTVIGCASSRMKRVYSSLGMGSPPMGGPIGPIDCNTGGNSKCCSETAACIRYMPTDTGDFQLSALSSDLITMNGQRITPEMGSFPLFNEDICTIGSRVFLFLLPSDT